MNNAVYENQSNNIATTIFEPHEGSDYLSKIPLPHLTWAMERNDNKTRNRLVSMRYTNDYHISADATLPSTKVELHFVPLILFPLIISIL